jgi:hypothetical protein
MTELVETIDQAVKVIADREGKYLTFTLAEERCHQSARQGDPGDGSQA